MNSNNNRLPDTAQKLLFHVFHKQFRSISRHDRQLDLITSNKNRSNKRQERLIKQRMIEGTYEMNRLIQSSDNMKKITPQKQSKDI